MMLTKGFYSGEANKIAKAAQRVRDTHTQSNAMRHVQQAQWFQGQCHCTPVIHQRHSSGCPAAQMQWYENKGETTTMFFSWIKEANGVIREILFSAW